MDNITLKGMEFFGYHGALPEETVLGQRFLVDATLQLDLHEAGCKDALEASVNYAGVYEVIKFVLEGKPYKTLEAVAENICKNLYQHYPMIQHMFITVHKPGAPVPGIFQDVSVTLER